MTRHGEVLIAILNNPLDAELAHSQHWYRIPITSQQKWIQRGWPPRWLAFYQTKIFGQEAYSICYYARVIDIQQKYRWQLLPDSPHDERGQRQYHQLTLEPLQRLPQPILSRRRRRITFISTTWQKFESAAEINDLYDESSLEDHLWAELKRLEIQAERQEWVEVGSRRYALDFAVYCTRGKLDIETDGDEWHANPEKAAIDNLRDNDLESKGWQQLRFTTRQIQEQMSDYCVPTIAATINNLGGVDEEGKLLARKINPKSSPGMFQPGLFDG
jgi:very-short-patch-repair endonuclease